MEEAAKADYVVVIDNGEITAKGTPEQLKEQYSNDSMTIHTKNIEEVTKLVNELGFSYEINGDTVILPLESTLQAIPVVEQCKDIMLGFQVTKGTLDEAFIRITGREMRE